MNSFLTINDANVGELMASDANGRVPQARVMVGDVTGNGWGFLPPFTQTALFPVKGIRDRLFSRERVHEPFKIIRFTAFEGARRHRNHSEPTTGTFWHAAVWRKSWGAWRLAVIE